VCGLLAARLARFVRVPCLNVLLVNAIQLFLSQFVAGGLRHLNF
jgi:hypothetical protein